MSTNHVPGPGETKVSALTPPRTPPTVYKPVKIDQVTMEKEGLRVKIISFKIGLFDGALIRFEQIDKSIISPELARQVSNLVSTGYRIVVVESDNPELIGMLVTTLISVTTTVAVKRPGENTATVVFSVFNFPVGAKITIDF